MLRLPDDPSVSPSASPDPSAPPAAPAPPSSPAPAPDPSATGEPAPRPRLLPADELAARLGLPPELSHLQEALTHPSFSNELPRGRQRADNQRLEFLGDAVLGLLASESLMDRFPGAKEGELSLMRSLLVNLEALAAWARSVRLGEALRMGRGADAAGERERDSVLGDAVEALVGAAYVDGGMEVARALGAAIVAEPLGRLAQGGGAGRDAKSELQERVQAAGGPSPRYRTVDSSGPDHEREFVVVVEVSGLVLGEGRGRSKKLAEQAAARSGIEGLSRPPPATLPAEAEATPPGEGR